MPAPEVEFDDFFRSRMPGLVRNLYLASGDLERAEDCAQEAFIRAWQRWSKLEGEDPVAWVQTVAWRLCVDDWRAKRRRLARMNAPATEPSPSPSALSAEVEAARSLVAELPQTQRAVVVLHYVEDLAVEDVARVLRIPAGTVKSRLSRARERLRSIVVTAEEENP